MVIDRLDTVSDNYSRIIYPLLYLKFAEGKLYLLKIPAKFLMTSLCMPKYGKFRLKIFELSYCRILNVKRIS